MAGLTLPLLGPPLVELDGGAVQLGRHKAVALLAYLALTRQPHSRDALATLLWPELDQSHARGQLRRTLSLLNRALGRQWLIVDRETAGWASDAEAWIDVEALRQRLEACAAHEHVPEQACRDCIHLLVEAADLYQDGFLAGFTLPDAPGFDEWQFFEGEDLRAQVSDAVGRLARWHGGRGEYDAAIAYGRRWLALDALHEPAHRELMALYARSGQRAAALRQYVECERILGKELGVPPSPETTEIYEAIRAGRELPDGRPPRATASSEPPPPRRHNLPAQSTAFVGRKRYLDRLSHLLSDPDVRLVTVLGPGGSGKTRLALEAARGQLDNYEHGVFFVSLAPLSSIEAMVPTVAQAIGFSFHGKGDPRQQMLGYLRRKQMLLVLDNYEHLLAPRERSLGRPTQGNGTDLTIELLSAAPEVKIVVTSRTRLNLPGEQLLSIGGMDVPPLPSARGEVVLLPGLGRSAQARGEDRHALHATQYSAVQLFLQSACRVREGYAPTEDDLAHIAQICRIVEGMPLAILLAAAWMGVLGAGEIAEQIRQRHDLLQADWRGVPERQRSVRASFDHSWSLTTERERAVLARLSVFRGGFTQRAARAIAGAALPQVRALADKSWLQCMPPGRCELHELVRQYAAEKLCASPREGTQVRDRHAAHYLHALRDWAEDLKGPRQQAAMSEIEADLENARAAWEWAVGRRQVAHIAQALDGLCLYCEWRKRFPDGETACRLLTSALAQAGAVEGQARGVWTRALAWQSAFDRLLGRMDLARELLERSQELLDGEQLAGQDIGAEQAFVLLQLSSLVQESDCERARDLCAQAVDIYQALDERWWTAQALTQVGRAHQFLAEFDQGEQALQECLALLQTLGDRMGMAQCSLQLGVVAGSAGRLEQGERLAREALALLREIGERPAIADGLLALGSVQLWSGCFAEACSTLARAAELHDEQGNVHSYASDLHVRGWVQINMGLYEQARASVQAAHTLFKGLDEQMPVGLGYLAFSELALVEGRFDQARSLLTKSLAMFRDAGKRGEIGLALLSLAHAAWGLGRRAQAWEHVREGLWIAIETRTFDAALFAVAIAALLLAGGGEVERAVELYALAAQHPFIGNSRFREDTIGRHIATAAESLPPDAVAAAQERGRARELWDTAEELLGELDAQAPDGV